MKVIQPGHEYLLGHLDTDPEFPSHTHLEFVQRVGPKYPGNTHAASGTTSQEVLRALIERTDYVDRQNPCHHNDVVRRHLREALRWLEVRAAEARGDQDAADRVRTMRAPEHEPTCPRCGHLLCRRAPEEH